MTRVLRVATRGSALARWQAERVVARLGAPAELVIVTTRADQDVTTAIHALGGTGVFVKEVQDAVLRGEADVAVHSAKDLPALTPDALTLAAVPERADPRDALVGAALAAVPTGGRIGTGSVRRRAQLAAARPDLTFGELRGNIATRLERLDRFDAVVVAAAALTRLGLDDRVAEVLPVTTMLPQVAQGALAVECRADDASTLAALRAIDDADAHVTVRAERAFLRELGGGCTLPCGALAHRAADGDVTLEGLLASLDGRVVLRVTATGSDPDRVGVEVARTLLDERGGAGLLEDAPGGRVEGGTR
jgi:hydroxymethylbilane synthase